MTDQVEKQVSKRFESLAKDSNLFFLPRKLSKDLNPRILGLGSEDSTHHYSRLATSGGSSLEFWDSSEPEPLSKKKKIARALNRVRALKLKKARPVHAWV
jgi:hypothetical protein